MTHDLVFDGHFWTTRLRISSWEGYLDRSGAYGGSGPNVHSDGSVKLVFAPEARDDRPLSSQEMSMVEWFLGHEPAISASVKQAIFDHYPSFADEYCYDPEEAAEYLPQITSVEELRGLIGLYAVNVHQIAKNGIPYIGFEFGCTWDDEHGLGVLMHGTRCVEIGGCDTAFLLWIAEKDAES